MWGVCTCVAPVFTVSLGAHKKDFILFFLKKNLATLWIPHSFMAFKMLCVACTESDIFIVYTVIDGCSTGANPLFSVSIQTIIKGWGLNR